MPPARSRVSGGSNIAAKCGIGIFSSLDSALGAEIFKDANQALGEKRSAEGIRSLRSLGTSETVELECV